MFKYETQILEKFESLGFRPREKQVGIINNIIELFVDKNFKNVVLTASTGIGKSLIAIVVAEVLHDIKKETHKENRKKSFILTHTNTLSQQYEESYKQNLDMLKVMGSSNYECKTMKSDADDCIMGKTDSFSGIFRQCKDCEYIRVKKLMNLTDHILTSYAYFFTANLYSDHLDERLLTVYDEAHLLNDVFVDFMKIHVTDVLLDKFIQECDSDDLHRVGDLFKSCKKQLVEKLINSENLNDYLEELLTAYSTAKVEYKEKADIEASEHNYTAMRIYNKKVKAYDNLLSRVNDFFEYGYEHVIECNDKELMISTIFMKKMFQVIKNSDYHLFMSATIDKEFVETTLDMTSDEVAMVYGGNIFKPENKSIVNCDVDSFNYVKMQDKEFLGTISKIVNDIVKEHSDEKGVILVTSFKLGDFLSDALRKYINKNDIAVKVFQQTPSKNLKTILKEFKDYPEPSILISPSIFEGIDLPDDQSRYQIFVKAPYYSLGDKRIQYILNRYPAIYEKLALYRCIQGTGRSVRSETDFCVTYMLDSNLSRLFKSKHNVWKDEFKIYKYK